MKPFARILAAAALIAVVPLTAAAAPVLTITSPDNLANVHVGQELTFHVNVTGVDQPLDTLSATVRGTAAGVLAGPTDPIAGPILTDPLGFVGTSAAVDGGARFESYSDYFGPDAPITGDGLFFTFTVTAAAPGTATVDFLPGSVAAFAVGGSDPIIPTADSALSFQVVVPEPTLIAPLGLAPLLLRRRTICARA